VPAGAFRTERGGPAPPALPVDSTGSIRRTGHPSRRSGEGFPARPVASPPGPPGPRRARREDRPDGRGERERAVDPTPPRGTGRRRSRRRSDRAAQARSSGLAPRPGNGPLRSGLRRRRWLQPKEGRRRSGSSRGRRAAGRRAARRRHAREVNRTWAWAVVGLVLTPALLVVLPALRPQPADRSRKREGRHRSRGGGAETRRAPRRRDPAPRGRTARGGPSALPRAGAGFAGIRWRRATPSGRRSVCSPRRRTRIAGALKWPTGSPWHEALAPGRSGGRCGRAEPALRSRTHDAEGAGPAPRAVEEIRRLPKAERRRRSPPSESSDGSGPSRRLRRRPAATAGSAGAGSGLLAPSELSKPLSRRGHRSFFRSDERDGDPPTDLRIRKDGRRPGGERRPSGAIRRVPRVGLLRGRKHPELRATRVDLDRATPARGARPPTGSEALPWASSKGRSA